MKNKELQTYKIISFLGKKVIAILEFFIKKNIQDKPVYDPVSFNWIQQFNKNHIKILNEYLAMVKHNQFPDISEISEEQNIVVNKKEWHFFPFYIYGNRMSNNLVKCPETAKLLAIIPNLTTAFFSVLQPGTHIKEHRGAFKGYLKFHFGIKIPEPNSECAIRIEDKIYYWENGQAFIFDDTYLHEVWNNSNQERAVLYVDFIRPMPKILILLSKGLTRLISNSPYIQNSLAKLRSNQYDASV